MNKVEAIKVLLGNNELSDIETKVDELTKKVDLLLSVIVIPQQLAADVAGVNRNTILNRARRGEFDFLQKDGSSLNFVTLKQAGELKRRRSARNK